MNYSPADRRAAIESRYPEWEPMTLAQALNAACELYPDRPLVLGEDRTYTYREVQELSRQLAAGFYASGLRPGDHIGIILANYPEFAIVKFAIANIGAVAVPINYQLRREELRYILGQSDVVCLITMDVFRGRDYLEDLDELVPDWEVAGGRSFPKLRHVVVYATGEYTRLRANTLEAIMSRATPQIRTRLHAEEQKGDPHFWSDIIYTSGTTGLPKGVVLTHDMILRTAYASAYTRAFEDGRRIVFSSPMYHVLAYVECLVACMFVGGAVVPQVTFDPHCMLSSIERHHASEIITIPFMAFRLLDAARERGFDASSVLAVFNSAGVSPPTLWADIRSVLGAREVLTGYGMTETTASTTCTLPEGDDSFVLSTNGRLKQAGVAGDPSLGGVLAVYKTIDAESSKDLPYGTLGELLVRGPIVTRGYYNKPDETRGALTEDGWLHTGDLGTIDSDGNLSLRGRLKEAYRCGGEMVMPREVEELLGQHPMVSEALVVGVPDKKMGEVGCACIVPMENVRPSAKELIDFCRERLARFKVPLHILFIKREDISVTATGRPQKMRLREFAIKTLEQNQVQTG
jgi:fatty-acyl-CoA synthase